MNTPDLRIQSGLSRGEPFYVTVDGQPVVAYAGETVATVLIAAGLRPFRRTLLSGEPRALYCGMGVCFDCLVSLNGRLNVRACLTPVRPGDQVRRQL
jgi:predicted molibdopterin-dependent oxidoreductase YjgC